MIPWNLDDKELYDWALQRLAKEELLEQKEKFAEANPPERLTFIYGILDEKVEPLMRDSGIPISREDLHKVFLSWFVKSVSPERKQGDDFDSNPRRGYRTRDIGLNSGV